MLLSEIYENNIDPTGWYCSEKLDGIRAYWTGKFFITRNNTRLSPPDFFTKTLPAIPLDGELWLGRKSFEETSSIVRSSQDKGWNKISYVVFDLPTLKTPVEDRWNNLKKLVDQIGKPLQFAHQHVIKNKEELYHLLDLITSSNGEGLMLRKPKSLYEFKRSNTLLKLKKFFDEEATVVGYTPLYSGDRVVENAFGALECLTSDGIAFKVGTGFSEAARRSPPPIGSTITYKFQEKSKTGKPRFPSFIRIKQ